MAQSTAGKSSDLIDPLVNYSDFSFNSSSIFRPLSNPNHLDSLASHLINMAGKNPDLLVNQAKAVQEGSKNPFESDKTAATTSEDKIEVPITVNDNKPRERVGLANRKRAEFSMRPMPSKPVASLMPTLDIDKLADPVEFFAAIDRMENAEKELRRLRGEPREEIDLHRVYVPIRQLGPSVLGRTTVYKHRSYPSLGSPSNDDALISSQEARDSGIISPPAEDARPEANSGNRSPETRVSDVKPASKRSELDELLSYDYEGLDDAAVQKLLEEKLNIKNVDTDEPSLPDFFRRFDSRSNISLVPDTIYQANDTSKPYTSQPIRFSHHFGKSSPALPKSPLAAISTMNKHISRLAPLKDPFPFLPEDGDSSPEAFSHLKDQNSKQGAQTGIVIDSQEISRPSAREDYTDITHLDRTSAREDDPEILLSAETKHVAPSNHSEECVDEIRRTEQTSATENLFETRTPTNEGDNLEGPNEISAFVATEDVDGTSVPTKENNQKTDASLNNGRKKTKELIAPSKEKINEDTMTKGRKRKAKSKAEPKNKKKKGEDSLAVAIPSDLDEKKRRNSLYGAGTKWDAGVRRSTRIRMRPLEFWRGERFLYGRVHASLVSVIGVKYASPAKSDEERAVKVKSFVSDEHKKLLDLASSY